MRLPPARRFAIIAAIGVMLSLHHASAHGQSLFNNRASAGPGRSSATSTAGSLFSSNIGFPQPATANATQGATGSFVGRSNRGFVGSRASSQSSSSGGETGNPDRRSAGSRTATGARGGGVGSERAPTPSLADGQREASSGVRRTPIVFRHRIAFEFPAKQATAITGQLTKQLANLADRYPDFAQIKVFVEPDGLVKLQGQVPSDDTSKLAAIIAGLEPGVRGVQNELEVAGDRD